MPQLCRNCESPIRPERRDVVGSIPRSPRLKRGSYSLQRPNATVADSEGTAPARPAVRLPPRRFTKLPANTMPRASHNTSLAVLPRAGNTLPKHRSRAGMLGTNVEQALRHRCQASRRTVNRPGFRGGSTL
jgi:hypothetical protein